MRMPITPVQNLHYEEHFPFKIAIFFPKSAFLVL